MQKRRLRRFLIGSKAGENHRAKIAAETRFSRPFADKVTGMTYCLGIVTKYGLIMASDSRSNAGYDQVNIVRKMHTFVLPGERVFIVLTSGSLSLTQSIMTLLRRDFEAGKGLATAPSMYDATRVVGEQVRRVSDMDREAL